MPKVQAIIYCSNTGFTAQYAALIAEKSGLVALPFDQAADYTGKPVLFLGWVRASALQKLKEAQADFDVRAVCAVGMNYAHEMVIEELKKANSSLGETPLFYLQGGFDKKKLRGINKAMLTVALSAMRSTLLKKADKSSEEEDMLVLLENGGSRVNAENLAPVLEWLAE